MRLDFNVLLLAFSALTQSLPSHHKRDTDLASLQGLTKLDRDHSFKDDPLEKYFHEADFHPHYDGRFASKPINRPQRLYHLRLLVRTYLSTMHALGAETWIMHGSLLGWYWNRRIMPWDSDIDVQVSEPSIKFLADYYNMTVHHFKGSDLKIGGQEDAEGAQESGKDVLSEEEMETLKREGKKYLLEINPNWENPSEDDYLNVIDARWIDISTGLFIDITTLRRMPNTYRFSQDSTQDDNAEEDADEYMMCKDKHRYFASQIFPLRTSSFEDTPVKVPYSYGSLLEEEYGKQSLSNPYYKGWEFEEEKKEWVYGKGRGSVTQSQMQEEERKAESGRPNRGKKPSRKPVGGGEDKSKEGEVRQMQKVEGWGGDVKSVDGKAYGLKAGREGEVHHAPGSSNDY